MCVRGGGEGDWEMGGRALCFWWGLHLCDTQTPLHQPTLPMQVFAEHPERFCTEIVLQDAENKVWWHYLVQASGVHVCVRARVCEGVCERVSGL